MRTLGKHGHKFPSVRSDCDEWSPTVERAALARRVLCVARTRVEGAWGAYVDSVAGLNHEDEWQHVLRHGNKLPEHVARVLFPEFEGVPYAH